MRAPVCHAPAGVSSRTAARSGIGASLVALTADLTHWQDDTFRIRWRDPMNFPKGLLPFAREAKAR